jgi:hypothetical protein
MTISKSHVVFVIVVVAAIAVAAVTAVHGHGPSTALATYGAENPATAGLADTSTVASSTGDAATALDPAKQQPTLDQFTSRNPFVQATSAPTAGAASSSSSTSSTPATVAANLLINSPSQNGKYTLCRVGTVLPPTSSVFKITAIGSSGVAFALINGYTLNGGTGVGPIAESTTPTSLTLKKGSSTYTYSVEVVWIGSSATGTSGSSSTTSTGATGAVTHSIKAVAITTASGVPSATVAVDGTTLAPQKVGDVASTSWGQIEIIGINGPAQTITILHADAQLTVRVGQAVSQ